MKYNSFILMGNIYERTHVLNQIKKEIGDYDLNIYDETYNYSFVSESIFENSCFGNKRLFIINGLPTIEAPNASQGKTKVLNNFKKILKQLNDDTFVIFNGIDIGSKKFLEEVNDFTKILNFPQKLDKSKAQIKTEKFFSNLDKEISSEDCFFIVNSIDVNNKEIDMDKTYLLLHQLLHVVGNKKKITKEDILSVCFLSQDFIVWNLFNQLDKNNEVESLKLIDSLFLNSLSIEHDVVQMLSAMIWRYRLLFFVKECLEEKMSVDQIWNRLESFSKLDKKGSGMQRVCSAKKNKQNENIPVYSRNVLDMLFTNYSGKSAVGCYTRKHLSEIFPLIEESLIKIRSGCEESEIRVIVELICLVICKKVEYRYIKGIIKSNFL